jgi:hypothetical protein
VFCGEGSGSLKKSASNIHAKIVVIGTDLPCVLFSRFPFDSITSPTKRVLNKMQWAKRILPNVSKISSRNLGFQPVGEVLPLKIPLT